MGWTRSTTKKEGNNAGRYFDRRRLSRKIHIQIDDRVLDLWDRIADHLGLKITGRYVVLERALLAYAKELGVPPPAVSESDLQASFELARRLTKKY